MADEDRFPQSDSDPVGVEVVSATTTPKASATVSLAGAEKLGGREDWPPLPHIFFSYSHSDEHWMRLFRQQFAPAEKQNLVTGFSDQNVKAGESWHNEIQQNLNRASVAILLLTADFLASDYCLTKEVKPLLDRLESSGGNLRIIPVLVEPCTWELFPKLRRLQIETFGGQALSEVPQNRVKSYIADFARGVLKSLGITPPEDDPNPDQPSPGSPVLVQDRSGSMMGVLDGRDRFGRPRGVKVLSDLLAAQGWGVIHYFMGHGRHVKIDLLSTALPKDRIYVIGTTMGGTGAGTFSSAYYPSLIGRVSPLRQSSFVFDKALYESVFETAWRDWRDEQEPADFTISMAGLYQSGKSSLLASYWRYTNPHQIWSQDLGRGRAIFRDLVDRIYCSEPAKKLGLRGDPDLQLVRRGDRFEWTGESGSDSAIYTSGGGTGRAACAMGFYYVDPDWGLIAHEAGVRSGLLTRPSFLREENGIGDRAPEADLLYRTNGDGKPSLVLLSACETGTGAKARLRTLLRKILACAQPSDSSGALNPELDFGRNLFEEASRAADPVGRRERVLPVDGVTIYTSADVDGTKINRDNNATFTKSGGRCRNAFGLFSPEKLDFRWILRDQIKRDVSITGNAAVDSGFQREILLLTQASENPNFGGTDEIELFGLTFVNPEVLYGTRVELLPF